MIDTLKYTRELEKAGFGPKQAELIVRTQIEMMQENVATKSDLKEVEYNLRLLIQRQEVTVQKQGLDFEKKLNDLSSKMGRTVIGSATLLGVFLGILIQSS